MKAILVLPFDNGIQFPGLVDIQPDFCTLSYTPPPIGTAPYVLAEIRTDTANVDILATQPNVLYLCEVTEDGYVPAPLTAQDRNNIRAKVASMGFTGAQYGLLNAAIQASQNNSDLVYALAENAFFRTNQKDFMREQDLRGAGLG